MEDWHNPMTRGTKYNRLGANSSPIAESSVKAVLLKRNKTMNWRNKIEHAISAQLSHRFPSDSAILRVEIYKAIKRTLNKCRLKYAGSDYRMLRMPNDINTIKKYVVGKNTYKVTTSLKTNRNGWVGESSGRTVQKRLTYDSLDMVPQELRFRIDWRARKLGYVVWDFVSYSNSSQTKEDKE